MKLLVIILGLSITLTSCDGESSKEEATQIYANSENSSMRIQKYSCTSFYSPGDLVLMGGSDGETSQKIIECLPFKN